MMPRRSLRTLHCLPLVAAMAIMAACSSTPSGIIPPDKMARVIADLNTAESVVEQHRTDYPTDSAKRLLRQSIFARYGYTSEDVDTSLKWYGYHTDRYVEVYDKVITILEDEIADAEASAGAGRTSTTGGNARFVVSGDSVNVWPDASWRRFSATMPSDITPFVLNSDQHWERGDLYELSSRMTSAPGTTEMVIVAEYQNGNKEYNRIRSAGDGWKRTSLALDPEQSATALHGYIRYIPSGNEQAFADSISLIRRRSDDVRPGQRSSQLYLSNRYGR